MPFRFNTIHFSIIVVLMFGATFACAQASSKSKKLTSDGANEEAYLRWLNQDVRWIITPQERASFSRLSNIEDRDRFIEDFWLHHDKREHYARIEYTNEHFTIAINSHQTALAGWLTDRGRIYIVDGPPDVITGLAGEEKSDVKQAILWHYRSTSMHKEGVTFAFVDVCACGDYRLEGLPSN